jgi:hypothetical protein
MDPEVERQFQEVSDAHDEAVRALRAANLAVGDATTAMSAAIKGHGEAIDAALKATHGAIALFNRLRTHPRDN